MHPLFKMAFDKDVHAPDSTRFAGPVFDFQRKALSNGNPLHVYRYCRCCGNRASSPVKRKTITFAKGREPLIASRREVCR